MAGDKNNPMQKQREQLHFRQAVTYVEQNASGLKRITTSELAVLNKMITEANDPWRMENAAVKIPSGKTHQFQVVANPIHQARTVLGTAQQMAGESELAGAAVHVYTQLVLLHLFKDANRRTAALATLWVLRSHGAGIDADKLAEMAVGDLRESADMARLTHEIENMIS
jgi:prophage maintenance system killer protein